MNSIISKRNQTTIQTQNAVNIAASGSSVSSFIDCDGFDKVGTTSTCDAATASTLQLVWSNDGVNNHYYETISTASATSKGGLTDIKARYVKVNLINGDAGAAHVMSAWILLKA
jgi:hypothetical protein